MEGTTKSMAVHGPTRASLQTDLAPVAAKKPPRAPLPSSPTEWRVVVEMTNPVPVLAYEIELIEFHFAELLDRISQTCR